MNRRGLSLSVGVAAALMGLACTAAAQEAEEIVLEVNGAQIAVVNDTEAEVISAEVRTGAADAQDDAGTDASDTQNDAGEDAAAQDDAGTDTADAQNDTGTDASDTQNGTGTDAAAQDGADASCTVVLTTADGERIFEDAKPEAWTDAKLVEEQGFWYIQYTDAEGSQRELAETADLVELDEPLTMWTLTDVYVREAADGESEALAVANLGDECSVTAALPGWYQVEYGEVAGYINHKFLTDDEAEAEAAGQQEQAARDAAAAANSYSFSGNGGGGGQAAGGGDPQACLENGLMN